MSPRRRLMLVALVVLVLAGLGAVVLSRILGGGADERVEQEEPGPVLLVPGLRRQHVAWSGWPTP